VRIVFISFFLIFSFASKLYSNPVRKINCINAIHIVISGLSVDNQCLYVIKKSIYLEKSGYLIPAGVRGNEDPVIYTVNAQKPNWGFKLVSGLIGGLGLFLFGMKILSTGLQKSAGDKMRGLLSKLTNNFGVAFLAGIFVTVVLQSSSATLVMLVSFVNSKLMRFRQSIGIFMGAAIGTTITAQIIAFNISEYSLLFIGLGFFTYLISKKQIYKYTGEAILGFGILFFGMFTMSDAMVPLRSYEPFIKALTMLENPFFGILIGTVATALIQSSGAFIGILIVLASQGLITLHSSIPLLIGTNLGTTVTALLASIEGTRESKQVSVAFAIYKATGALLIIWWIPGFAGLVENISSGTGDGVARQIANAHTVYNVFLALIFLPLNRYFEKFIRRIIPFKEQKEEEELKSLFLDDSVLSTPSLALTLAKQETLRLMKIVEEMASLILIPFISKKKDPLDLIDHYEKQADFLHNKINKYLVKVSQQDVRSERVEEAFRIMFTVNEFEQMADLISLNLREKAHEWCENESNFSDKGKEELISFHSYTLDQIKRAQVLYESFNVKEAKVMKEKYKEYRKLGYDMEKQHFGRLLQQVEDSVSSSKMHIELITLFKLIAGHATNTARILITK
jgi:phosphate:Na+ symporter